VETSEGKGERWRPVKSPAGPVDRHSQGHRVPLIAQHYTLRWHIVANGIGNGMLVLIAYLALGGEIDELGWVGVAV
jgi:hypothetical protein